MWYHHAIGESAARLEPPGLPEETLVSIRDTKVAIKGPTATPLGGGHRSINVRLREKFRLRSNVRPIRTMPGVKTRFSDVSIDLVIFRENLEDLYVGDEHKIHGGVQAISRITVAGSRAIAESAFAYARAHGRKRVTIVHKANILKESHGLFLRQCQGVAKDYPEIACDDIIADNCMMQLVRNPERFDVLVATNLIGDLLSDLCAGLIGGLGFAPGANIGNGFAIFEAVHGTAPDIVGKGIANPIALILSGAMMLDHIGESSAARRVRGAVDRVLAEDNLVTPDGRVVSSEAIAQAVIKKL
jgi:isocitrate dehydrogenase (NAD+)